MGCALRSVDIYLLPSARIHVVSILQAMSYGLAVVASDGWGMKNILNMAKRYDCPRQVWKGHGWIRTREYYGKLRCNVKGRTANNGWHGSGVVKLVKDRYFYGRSGNRQEKTLKQNTILKTNKGLKEAFDKALNKR